MSEWKTYIVDDFTPFHSMAIYGEKFDRILKNDQIAIAITNGKQIEIIRYLYKKDALINSNKKLRLTNLKDESKKMFKYIVNDYKNTFGIKIPEPTLYKPRKITI